MSNELQITDHRIRITDYTREEAEAGGEKRRNSKTYRNLLLLPDMTLHFYELLLIKKLRKQ